MEERDASPPPELLALADEEPADVFINAPDGLPNLRPDAVLLAREDLSPDPLDELPKALIVTNVRADIFEEASLRADLEALFRGVRGGADATFHWLRSFRRLRVTYETANAAAEARVKLHQFPFPTADTRLGCYFAQPVTPASATSLVPPQPTKQFLISPPSSPPLGWEPRPEHEPLVNRDLLAALAQLSPGEGREVVPPRGSHPAIVVHAALRPEDD